MNKKPLTLKNLALCTFLVGTISCSSKVIVQDFPSTAAPANEISNLERDLQSAKDKQVDILSPNDFQKAQANLEEAKSKFLNGEDPKKTLHSIASGKAYLNNANTVAELSRENVADIITAREMAKKAEADRYFSRDFKKIDAKLSELTKKSGGIKVTQKELESHSIIKSEYKDLELRAIIEKTVGESRDVISKAKLEKADKYAPRTLAIAEKQLADTIDFIKLNPEESAEIKVRAMNTKAAAYRVYNINFRAKNTAKISTEEMAIALEDAQEKSKFNETKADIIEEELKTTQSALDREKEAQNELAMTKEQLTAQNEKLVAEKKYNDKFEEARKNFTSNEAEIFRQGDALLIRLKGIEFPSSKATINSSNYSLLSKVEKVVKDFGVDSKITIEGHSDSIGGKTINNRLSAQRAKAVKDYLEANSGGIEYKIETIGLGDQKPLTTNKTAEGRAKNRRVDIIITPESTNL